MFIVCVCVCVCVHMMINMGHVYLDNDIIFHYSHSHLPCLVESSDWSRSQSSHHHCHDRAVVVEFQTLLRTGEEVEGSV